MFRFAVLNSDLNNKVDFIGNTVISLPNSITSYTPDYDGWLSVSGQADYGHSYIQFELSNGMRLRQFAEQYYQIFLAVPLKKGQTVNITLSFVTTAIEFKFYH